MVKCIYKHDCSDRVKNECHFTRGECFYREKKDAGQKKKGNKG